MNNALHNFIIFHAVSQTGDQEEDCLTERSNRWVSYLRFLGPVERKSSFRGGSTKYNMRTRDGIRVVSSAITGTEVFTCYILNRNFPGLADEVCEVELV